MALLIARRIAQGETMTLLTATMPLERAEATLAEIGALPGQRSEDTEDAEGERWFEVADDVGDLVRDPVCFPASVAHATLGATGVAPAEAIRLLSPTWAASWREASGRT